MKKESPDVRMTLLFPVTNTHILLGIKQDKIGQGLWNGFGGRIEAGESILDAAVRESWEEVELRIEKMDLNFVAVLDVYNRRGNGDVLHCRIYIFFAYNWNGVPEATKEMHSPTWFERDKLPLKEMMLADHTWLPHILSSETRHHVKIWYGPDQMSLERKVHIRSCTLEDLNRL